MQNKGVSDQCWGSWTLRSSSLDIWSQFSFVILLLWAVSSEANIPIRNRVLLGLILVIRPYARPNLRRVLTQLIKLANHKRICGEYVRHSLLPVPAYRRFHLTGLQLVLRCWTLTSPCFLTLQDFKTVSTLR